MKRLVLILILTLTASHTWARGLADSYKAVKKTAVDIVTPEDCDKTVCPPCSDSEFEDIERADLDVTIMFDMIDNPGEGRYDFYLLDNYHITVNYNLTAGFYAYGSVGQKKYKKTEVSDAIYDSEWSAISLFGGAGIYITPVISVHAGVGKMWVSNDAGDPPIKFGIEYGLTYDIPWGTNKIQVSWKMVEVGLDKDDDSLNTAAELQGNPSYSSFGIGLSIPFMR